jgi:hypothetical protein
MIKLFFCVTRKRDVSIQDFRRLWNEHQVPLLTGLASATGAVRQVYNTTLAVEQNERFRRLRGTREPYDAVSEIWWKNARDLEVAMASPEMERMRDELFQRAKGFIDHARSCLFFAQEEETGPS